MKRVVQFENIGRGKRSWQAEIEWSESAIIQHLRKSGALASRELDVVMTRSNGTVFAGLFAVGAFRAAGEEVTLCA